MGDFMKLLTKQKIQAGSLEKPYRIQLERARKADLITKIISKNPSVFGKRDPEHRIVILNRLGWIDVIRRMPKELSRIENLVEEVRRAGLCHLFILGMGGSSLCPEVFGKIFGYRRWLKSYTVLDSTAPSQLEAALENVDLTKSFFIVSSKSGTTIETLSQFRFLFDKVKDLRPLKVGGYFAAVTDAGSELHRMARRNRFREICLNPSDIGGRYSALSFFGLVPGGFTKANLNNLLQQAEACLTHMEAKSKNDDALLLGALLGCAFKQGRDKLVFRPSPSLMPFIPWVEQLVAESTGKEGKGIIPVEGESYEMSGDAKDRLYVRYVLKRESLPTPSSKINKPPIATIELADAHAVGAEMLKWEMTTAVASAIIGVNPFDEPNVTESKKNTAAILSEQRGHHKIIVESPLFEEEHFNLVQASDIAGLRRPGGSKDVIRAFIDGVAAGDYIAVLCYCEMSPEIEKKLTMLRQAIAAASGVTVLRGYGPRFLHSIGQLYKGGEQKGHFLVLEREYTVDFEIPKMKMSFAKLIKAQAEGDMRALRKRHRPLIDINLKMEPAVGLAKMLELISDNQ